MRLLIAIPTFVVAAGIAAGSYYLLGHRELRRQMKLEIAKQEELREMIEQHRKRLAEMEETVRLLREQPAAGLSAADQAREQLKQSRKELVAADGELQQVQRALREAAAGKNLGDITLKDGTVYPNAQVQKIMLDAIVILRDGKPKTLYRRQLPEELIERYGIGTPSLVAAQAAAALRQRPFRKPAPVDPEALKQHIANGEGMLAILAKEIEGIKARHAQAVSDAAAEGATSEKGKQLAAEVEKLKRSLRAMEGQIKAVTADIERNKARLKE